MTAPTDPAHPAGPTGGSDRSDRSDRLPEPVAGWVGRTLHAETARFPAERGHIWTSCASVENGNPLFWDDEVARRLTGGPVAPPTTLSLWFRPHAWEPGEPRQRLPLQVHFDLKDRLDLPEAVMTDSEVVFGAPVRPGDVISTSQVLRSVSPPKTTRLGTGRFWVIDVDYRNQDGTWVGTEIFTGYGYRRPEPSEPEAGGARSGPAASPGPASDGGGTGGAGGTDGSGGPDRTGASTGAERVLTLGDVSAGDTLPELVHPVSASTVVLGALATRDWRPMHHDVDFAVNRNGARDIFLNTPNQQAWFERFITDWTGPRGRLGRLRFRMRDSVYPGDTMRITGTVARAGTDGTGCGWVEVTVELHAGITGTTESRLCTSCDVRAAVPTSPGPADDESANPWRRHGDAWRP